MRTVRTAAATAMMMNMTTRTEKKKDSWLEAAATDWQEVALNFKLADNKQGKHVDAPVLGWYSKILHAQKELLPSGQLLPAGHGIPEEDCCGQ
jgi:hypothetical protein